MPPLADAHLDEQAGPPPASYHGEGGWWPSGSGDITNPQPPATRAMPRRILSVVALVIAVAVLAGRVHEINRPPAPVQLAPRTVHLLYIDSLRRELLTFAEQYGRPVFRYDTTSPVTGHGRIQLARLREALFDPRIEYFFGDEGFNIDWRADPKPRSHSKGFMAFGAAH